MTIEVSSDTTVDIDITVPRGRPAARSRSVSLTRISGHVLLLLLAALSIFPVYWMIVTSFRAPNDIYSADLLPSAPSLDNYVFAFQALPIVRMLVNTVVMATLVTAMQLFTGLLAAFAFARWRFPLDKVLYGLLALTWLVPFQVTMIPNYLVIISLGLLDTLTALIIPHVAAALAVMLLYQAMRSFPKEVIEAARVDGASNWSILWGIITPNLRASLASLAILLFISSWNDYFWPLLLSRTPENTVIQLGVQMFQTAEGNLWGPLMAASTLACLPILLLYVVLQRQVISSFMKSGLR
jgi:ABC-type glycerol-3-phosphate transport system permease component